MLAGLDDQHLSDETLKNLLQEQKNELFIVLAHEPQYLQNYANAGADLVLTGHAHGGQIRLPFVGGNRCTRSGIFTGIHIWEI